jgi:sugar-specific transcriptional regulator TrmB
MAYIALLKLKQATILQIARLTNIKRTSLYYSLESLVEKGLAVIINKDGKSLYVAEDPVVSLKSLEQQRKNTIENVLPELKSIFGQGAWQPEIKIYRQISGLKMMFEDSLKAKEKINRYYISSFGLEDLMGEEFVNNFVAKRIKSGVKSYSLRSFTYKPPREKEISHRDSLREVRFLPEETLINPYICIYDNKVVVVATKEERVGFIIESKEFADAQKAIFDLLWQKAAM